MGLPLWSDSSTYAHPRFRSHHGLPQADEPVLSHYDGLPTPPFSPVSEVEYDSERQTMVAAATPDSYPDSPEMRYLVDMGGYDGGPEDNENAYDEDEYQEMGDIDPYYYQSDEELEANEGMYEHENEEILAEVTFLYSFRLQLLGPQEDPQEYCPDCLSEGYVQRREQCTCQSCQAERQPVAPRFVLPTGLHECNCEMCEFSGGLSGMSDSQDTPSQTVSNPLLMRLPEVNEWEIVYQGSSTGRGSGADRIMPGRNVRLMRPLREPFTLNERFDYLERLNDENRRPVAREHWIGPIMNHLS